MDNSEIKKDLTFLHENLQYLNQNWQIEDPPVQSHVPVMGGIITIFKRLIRKTVYWLIKPYWNQQISFNNYLTAAVGDIYRIQSGLIRMIEEQTVALPEDMLLHTSGPRVIQLVSSLNFGDAVGNEVIAFKKVLQENGFSTEIYTNHIHKKIPVGTARFYRDMPPLKKDDVVIYHFASECAISNDIKDFPCKVILRYHNVTPPEFFHGFDENAEKATKTGLEQVKSIRPYIDYCLPVSDFNMHDLQKMGYSCPMQVMPILINFDDYKQEPDPEVIKKYRDGMTNILFVGRIAPNKKIEDVISAFAYYKEHYDQTARLFLVGSYQETDRYYQFLCRHIEKLSVKDVIFSGHISFPAILAYYRVADLFLCMSEHEGFCVPLVEAMYFGVPIVAYDSSAVSSTMGESGILITNKELQAIAEGIVTALENAGVMQKKENVRLEYFSQKRVAHQFVDNLKKITQND